MTVRALLLLLAVAGVAGGASLAAQALPASLDWRLGRADVLVRRAADGRYVVESFLEYHPPARAHPAIDPGALTVWFFGDAARRSLQVTTSRINGRDVNRVVSTGDPRGTQVGLHITPENRMAPLAVHLTVLQKPVQGRVAIPISVPNQGVEVTITRPDGSRRHEETLPPSVVVDPRQAGGLGRPVLAVAVGACFLAAIGLTVLVLRRK